MLGATWLNLGSLIFGLIAWTLPVLNLLRRNKENSRNWIVLCMASIGACAISLCMQLFYTDYLVKIEDWSALMDTSSAVALVAAILLAVTITFNATTLILYHRKNLR